MVAPAVVAAGIGALGSVVGGLFGRSGARAQNRMNLQIAREQMAFEERMANTEIQRRVADLQGAGLNPLLSIMGMGAASSPSPPMAQVVNEEAPLARGIESAAQIAASAAQIRLAEAQARKIGAEASILESQVPWSARDAQSKSDALFRQAELVGAQVDEQIEKAGIAMTENALRSQTSTFRYEIEKYAAQAAKLEIPEKQAIAALYEKFKEAKGAERLLPLILAIFRSVR